MIYTVITIIIIIASILLVGVVLIQNSKGGGLASGFAAQNQIMGVKKTTDYIEKTTWTLVAIVVFLSVVSAAFIPKHENATDSELRNQFQERTNSPQSQEAPSTTDFGGTGSGESK